MLAGLLLALCGLTLSASVAGLAVAAPLLLLLSPVLAPRRRGVGGAGPRGPLHPVTPAAQRGGRRPRPCGGGEAARRGGERTPHAALAVVSRGQGATDHKKADNYYHYVAGRMVPNA